VTSNTASSVVSALQDKGFNVTQKTVTSSTVTSGNAIDIQDANGNSLVGKEEPVTTPLVVIVSGGPAPVTVPSDVINEPCTTADAELANDGFNVNSQFTYETNQSFAAQTTITTNPAPGSSEPKGTAITIVCSEGAGTTTPTASASASASASAGNGGGGFIQGLGGGNN
jgi:eukaryotic-like serine/threonine-protein kinase